MGLNSGSIEMPKRLYSVEQIINHLREATCYWPRIRMLVRSAAGSVCWSKVTTAGVVNTAALMLNKLGGRGSRTKRMDIPFRPRVEKVPRLADVTPHFSGHTAAIWMADGRGAYVADLAVPWSHKHQDHRVRLCAIQPRFSAPRRGSPKYMKTSALIFLSRFVVQVNLSRRTTFSSKSLK